TLQSRWLPAVFGYGAVATAAGSFGVQIWLGPHYLLGGLVAAVLMAGYSVHVGLTGMRTCFVRAVGQPGLETRYSVVTTALNVILTIPLALLFGVVGVVSATAAALILASLYFMRLCRRLAGLHEDSLSRQWFATISVAALLTVTGEIFVAATPWRGMLGLGMAGIPALLGLGVLCGQTVRRGLAPLAAYCDSHNDHIS
uniref:polysaccharide biosynthesis C-terminal domain-containing protein n=1 Tax=Frankia sp. CiP3 TaxID=2880971 RepID=UPI001EF64184